MFACLLKIQLADAGVGTFPAFASVITDAEFKIDTLGVLKETMC